MIALCIGGAPSVWDDLERAKALVGDHLLVACNHAGIEYPGRVDVWATLHCELIGGWLEQRAAVGRNTDCQVVLHKAHPGVVATVVPMAWYGSSGLYMAQAALEMGAEGVVLCGVPLDAEAGHIAEPGPWVDPSSYRGGALKAKAEGANIRSMSGWTAETFGLPNATWLRSMGLPGRSLQPSTKGQRMHVRFTADHDYTPSRERRITTAYPAGWSGLVKRECGEAAIALGRAVEIPAPASDEAAPKPARRAKKAV